jgi:hypothetical protein
MIYRRRGHHPLRTNLMDIGALDQAIRHAIFTRHYLAYATPEGNRRVVEPHAYGISPENELALVCWRSASRPDATETGLLIEPDGWELVRLDEMRELRILDGSFETPRPGYRRGDTRLRSIFAQL